MTRPWYDFTNLSIGEKELQLKVFLHWDKNQRAVYTVYFRDSL